MVVAELADIQNPGSGRFGWAVMAGPIAQTIMGACPALIIHQVEE
ncbi:hypothetical protein AALA52_01100 [Lactococcus ileimucosae]|uniref:Uncharacterized protein n=1 Tax=Lactococcus ileimucosae TaxID=2941329 RepID=A0ABV4D2C5_9LACT